MVHRNVRSLTGFLAAFAFAVRIVDDFRRRGVDKLCFRVGVGVRRRARLIG